LNFIIKVKILNQVRLSKAHLFEIMIYLVDLIIIRKNILYLPFCLLDELLRNPKKYKENDFWKIPFAVTVIFVWRNFLYHKI